MKHILIFSLLTILSFAKVVNAATLDRALHFYELKEYQAAYEEFESLAAIGSSLAMLNVGVMYARGEHVSKDFEQAYLHLYMAHLADEPNAKKPLEIIGKKLTEDQKTALEEKAKVQLSKLNDNLAPVTQAAGNTAYQETGLIVERGAQPAYPKAMAKKGQDGIVDIKFFVDAHGYTRHHIVTLSSSDYFKDAALSAMRKTYYKPAMINDKPITASSLNFRYTFRMDGEKKINKKKLLKYLDESKQQALAGSSQAQTQYGRQLTALHSVYGSLLKKQNIRLDNPNDWFLKAAQNGEALASFSLGANLLSGDQCLTEPNKALFWLEQSVNNGVLESYVLLGLELIYGYRVQQDLIRGFELLETAAEKGSTHAQIELVRFYASHPEPNIRNKEKALKYLEMISSDYPDKLSLYEARAAGHAAAGDFRNALKWQKEAVQEAKRLELPLAPMESHLASYQAEQIPVYVF